MRKAWLAFIERAKLWMETAIVAVVIAGGLGTASWALFLQPRVRACVVEEVANRPTVAKTDTIVHSHVDPLIDSLRVINRKQLRQAVYTNCQMEELLGTAKAARAEKRYLEMMKTMEGR